MKILDDFIARQESDELLDMLRNIQQNCRPARFKRYWRNQTKHVKERMTLGALAATNRRHEFVGTVVERGYNGRWRNILLEKVHPFGLDIISEDHIWMPYNWLWQRIEPFFQGCKVVLVGKAVAYTRQNGTVDYSINAEYVTTLWSRPSLPLNGEPGDSQQAQFDSLGLPCLGNTVRPPCI